MAVPTGWLSSRRLNISPLATLLPRALSIASALIVGPTFEEYAYALTDAGSSVQYVHAKQEDRFRPPLKEVLRQFSAKGANFDAVFLCNPNNPTGQAMTRRSVRELADAVERQRGRDRHALVRYLVERARHDARGAKRLRGDCQRRAAAAWLAMSRADLFHAKTRRREEVVFAAKRLSSFSVATSCAVMEKWACQPRANFFAPSREKSLRSLRRILILRESQ